MSPEVRFGDWISKGIDLYKQNFALLVLASLLAIIISVTTVGILAGPMAAGLILITLRLLRGQEPKPTVSNLFDGFNYFLQTLLFVVVWGGLSIVASFVLGLVPCIGWLLYVVGSLVLSSLLMFALFLIVDRNMDFWPASMASIAAVKTQFWPLLGFGIVAQLLGSIGGILCGIGAIFTMPILWCSMAVAYEVFMNGQTVELPPPPLPPPVIEVPPTPPAA